jgi:hypothetical protein
MRARTGRLDLGFDRALGQADIDQAIAGIVGRNVLVGQGRQLGCSGPFQSVRNRPRSARKPLKNRPFRVHRCSSPFVLIRSQPSDLLVSREQTFTAIFAIPNEGN